MGLAIEATLLLMALAFCLLMKNFEVFILLLVIFGLVHALASINNLIYSVALRKPTKKF